MEDKPFEESYPDETDKELLLSKDTLRRIIEGDPYNEDFFYYLLPNISQEKLYEIKEFLSIILLEGINIGFSLYNEPNEDSVSAYFQGVQDGRNYLS